jgi:hypothetical protein
LRLAEEFGIAMEKLPYDGKDSFPLGG